MKFLNHLLEANLDDLTSRSEQPEALPASTMDEIQKNIRAGVKPNKETGQHEKWANALHLVHKAYDVTGVQRPTPQMKEMWKQYEENIAYAVKQLAKERGLDADWRMTSHELSEALKLAKHSGILVEMDGHQMEVYITSADKVYETLSNMCRQNGYEMKVGDNNLVTFWKYGIKQKHYVKVLEPINNS